ncbi:TolC family protein [Rhodohalobacter barkolensis]|uniref:TolC family protein n=1 Tax=Rhodohalobacter barkolensis TaxID=2053187 RepID=A0A2N0VM13_9BACT|nr:TolC family protein [Rhodohalobacter barkolensis]PKD45243.1 TolC family protein [Rhodohalobacter barkolensis]
MQRILFLSLLVPLLNFTTVQAQDTLKVNLQKFIDRGLERSGQVAYERNSVDMSENRVQQVKNQRILPRIEFNSQHGVVPGVKSEVEGLSKGEYYLDPNLENDWEDWGIFTRAEISAIQPVYSWGAINNAIAAAEAGARAAEFQFSAVTAEAEVQLFELYYSYLLAQEVERILVDAEDQVAQIERQIENMQEEGDPDLKEADVFKFEIFKTEFEVQREEVKQSVSSITRIWDYVMGDEQGIVYEPEESFLDPVAHDLQSYDYYQQMAVSNRPELKGVDAGIEAMDKSKDAVKAQQYPALFLGISGSYANTPNRPRQTNPFIINNTNYSSAAVGFGIRQNLNFRSIRNQLERADIEYNRVQDLKSALMDGIYLDLNEKYREASVADVKVNQIEEALSTARNWVRHEQLNYDIGFGDVEELLNAMQKELELRVELKQNVFDLNKKVAALYRVSGISVQQLSVN